MRILVTAIVLALIVSVGLIAQGPAPVAPGTGPQIVWSPKAAAPEGWAAPHRPHTKLSELLARHNGRADWTETVVDDDTLHADYIAMAPGGKTPRRMNADTREWWAIQDGQVRFSIDGQEPFVASKGSLVQVPYRTPSRRWTPVAPAARSRAPLLGTSAADTYLQTKFFASSVLPLPRYAATCG